MKTKLALNIDDTRARVDRQRQQEAKMYDLIGDIHGCATALKALLEKMDYREQDAVGNIRHAK